ncbi:hypothetical protein GWI33_008988 [Rhynchophorus ferrugineus]|uniref:Uncharacterized protein n=1 Tax=Rhynchophorus ferrugineus TaxID=354439 RepID=A0A834IQ57_RHYFE|nr:hypothetical protein GWI33_008988 [Rhynchophorus ferrugineus]
MIWHQYNMILALREKPYIINIKDANNDKRENIIISTAYQDERNNATRSNKINVQSLPIKASPSSSADIIIRESTCTVFFLPWSIILNSTNSVPFSMMISLVKLDQKSFRLSIIPNGLFFKQMGLFRSDGMTCFSQ